MLVEAATSMSMKLGISKSEGIRMGLLMKCFFRRKPHLTLLHSIRQMGSWLDTAEKLGLLEAILSFRVFFLLRLIALLEMWVMLIGTVYLAWPNG